MSMGTIAPIGASGFGSTDQMGRTGLFGWTQKVAKPAARSSSWDPDPSTKVKISDAGKAALSSEGLQSGASMSDLAQALILALMLQMVQSAQSN